MMFTKNVCGTVRGRGVGIFLRDHFLESVKLGAIRLNFPHSSFSEKSYPSILYVF